MRGQENWIIIISITFIIIMSTIIIIVECDTLEIVQKSVILNYNNLRWFNPKQSVKTAASSYFVKCDEIN